MRVTLGLSALLVTSLPTSVAAQDCFAPVWQKLNDPRVGLHMEMASDAIRQLGLQDDFLYTDLRERGRHGGPATGRCSILSLTVTDFAPDRIADSKGLLEAEVQRMTVANALDQFKLRWSRSLTFQGYPAREIEYQYFVPFSGETASARALVVARESQ